MEFQVGEKLTFDCFIYKPICIYRYFCLFIGLLAITRANFSVSGPLVGKLSKRLGHLIRSFDVVVVAAVVVLLLPLVPLLPL